MQQEAVVKSVISRTGTAADSFSPACASSRPIPSLFRKPRALPLLPELTTAGLGKSRRSGPGGHPDQERRNHRQGLAQPGPSGNRFDRRGHDARQHRQQLHHLGCAGRLAAFHARRQSRATCTKPDPGQRSFPQPCGAGRRRARRDPASPDAGPAATAGKSGARRNRKRAHRATGGDAPPMLPRSAAVNSRNNCSMPKYKSCRWEPR